MAKYFLNARALIDGNRYCEVWLATERKLSDTQRESLELGLKHLLIASCEEPPAIEDIEVGVGELPWVDDDYHTGGDPEGKIHLKIKSS